jgi:hypothetical protein
MASPTKESVHRSMKREYKRYVRDCRRRNIFWELTIEQFHTLTSSNCTYCGRAPAQKARNYTYNGIDRLNSDQGYTLGNCAPCCKECNGIKSNRLNPEEMRIVGKALAIYRAHKK